MEQKSEGQTDSAQHVKWSTSYSTGIQLIDDQHKGLIHFVNELMNHVKESQEEDRDYFLGVINEVVKYSKNHFFTEEKYMLATRFPGYDEHKKTHDEFVEKVNKVVMDFDAGEKMELKDIVCFLKDWVLVHVAGQDKLYAQYFRDIATRKDDGKLTVSKTDVE